MRVLIAEDTVQHQLSYMTAFIKLHTLHQDLDFDIVEDGKSAVEKFEAAVKAGNPYDVILMDENMPVMSGDEAITKIRECEVKSGISKENQTKIFGTSTAANAFKVNANQLVKELSKTISAQTLLKELFNEDHKGKIVAHSYQHRPGQFPQAMIKQLEELHRMLPGTYVILTPLPTPQTTPKSTPSQTPRQLPRTLLPVNEKTSPPILFNVNAASTVSTSTLVTSMIAPPTLSSITFHPGMFANTSPTSSPTAATSTQSSPSAGAGDAPQISPSNKKNSPKQQSSVLFPAAISSNSSPSSETATSDSISTQTTVNKMPSSH